MAASLRAIVIAAIRTRRADSSTKEGAGTLKHVSYKAESSVLDVSTDVGIEAQLSPVERVQGRKLKHSVELGLVAVSAGRCEFRGCNKFLYQHPLTQDFGNFAENAHIVAFRHRGPRGRDGERPKDINGIDNLMLLCAPCHKTIDDNPEKYPRRELEHHKQEHEARIKRVSEVGPAMQTTVLQLRARIGTSVPEISRAEVASALMPRYPAGDTRIVDLTKSGDEKGGAFYELAAQVIDADIRRLYATGSDLEQSKHLSVFGLAPIPLLMKLGSALSNKVQTDFYQCHRDRADRWTWYEGAAPVQFTTTIVREGSVIHNVALILSLSGKIDVATLPASIDSTFSVYEILLQDHVPNPGFLRQRTDLEAFRQAYRLLLSGLRQKHPGLVELYVFPAIPAPVAIACGFDLLPKVDPSLVVFDHVKDEGGFVTRMKVMNNEQ